MRGENILYGPSLSDVKFKNISLGQLILNQLSIRNSWIAQVIIFFLFIKIYIEIIYLFHIS